MTDLRDDTRHLFEALTGRAPDGIWSAPGTVTLLGGLPGTDGTALAFPIDRRVIVALGLRDDNLIRVASTFGEHLAELSLTELDAAHTGGHLQDWPAYPLGTAWALGQQGADLAGVPGVDLVIDSNIPVNAGLGSSSAVVAAVARALGDAWRLELSSPALVQVARIAEPDAALPAPDLAAQIVSAVRNDGLSLAVIDTGLRNELPAHDAVFYAVEAGRVQDAVTALQYGSRFDAIAPLLAASHLGLRAGVTGPVPELDLAVETAYESGAVSVRMTPRGGGVVVVIPTESVSRLRVAIDGAYAEHGFASADVHVVAPSGGATRDA